MKNFRKRASAKLFEKTKDTYQKYLVKQEEVKQIVFIMGCQRSGTTLMIKILEKDINAKVYGEFSVLSSLDKDKIRLNPLDQVKAEIEKNKVRFIVLKPLVEAQNTIQLLNFFEGSKAIWMLRHYRDVASSNLKHFGIENGINNLRPIINGEKDNWRSEKVTDATKKIVNKFFSEDMPPYDAAALFWYVRNILFFELKLQNRADVMICRYEDLVTSPLTTIKGVYSYADIEYPGDKIVTDVHSRSINKGKSIHLSQEIDELCSTLLERFLVIYNYNSRF